MRRIIAGAIMLLLDLTLVIAGVVCLILAVVFGEYHNLASVLSLIGLIGIGSGIGSVLVAVGIPLLMSDVDK